MCDKIKKSITVYIPGNQCNLNCSYCYVTNSRKPGEGAPIVQRYPIEHMIKAFDPKRIGGICDIGLIGSAETLLEKNVIPFAHGLLHYGHIVSIVTNCTLTNRIEELIRCNKDDLKNLIVKASLHWTELKRLGLVDTFFNNIKAVIQAGGSAFPFLTVCDEYLPELEEIARTSMDYLGATPHCSPCVQIDDMNSLLYEQKFSPECTPELVNKINKLFDSPMYVEMIKNKEMNPQDSFCYAGLWSFGVDFASGGVKRCHGNGISGLNFYEAIECPFEISEPIGCSCRIASCCLQYNFFSEGIIPSYKSDYMYGDLIYKKGLVSEYVRDKLNVRFDEIYSQLSAEEQAKIILKRKNEQILEIHERYQQNLKNPFLNEIIYKMVLEGKKIVIYGTGKQYLRYKYTIGFDVEFFLDSFVDGEQTIDNKRVVRPEDVENLKDYFIVISPVKKKEIEQKLKNLGLHRETNYI